MANPDLNAPTGHPRRIGSNVLFSAAGRAWSAVLLLVTVPIVVHGIGPPAYGIFAVVTVILGYVAFLDFGLTAAVVRSVSRYRASGDIAGLERVVGTAFSLLIALGLAGAVAIELIGPWLAGSVLHIPQSLRADATFAFRVAGVGFGVNMAMVVFAGVVQGLQRLDVFGLRTIILSTLTSAAQIASVELGGGLRAVVVATFVVSAIGFLVFVAAAHRLLPGMTLRPRADGAAMRELGSFGLFRFLNQAAGQVTTQLDPIVIGIFQPISAVGFYAVPLALTQRFHVAVDSVASAYFPAAVEYHARRDEDRTRRLYLSAFKLVLVTMAFAAVVCAGYAGPILTAWVGRNIADHGTAIFVVLAIGYGLSGLIGIPAQASDATGHQRWTAAFALASAVIQLSLALILVPRYGPIGAAIAVVINTVTQGTIFVVLVQRRFLDLPLLTLTRQAVLRPAIATLVLVAFVLLTRSLLVGPWVTLAAVVAAGVIFAAATFLAGVWDADEVRLARDLAWAPVGGRSS